MRITAQVDTLTQVVHRRQVLFPQGIQRLQHHALLEVAHHFAADHVFLTLVLLFGVLQNAFAQRLFVQLRLFVQPLCDRHLQIEVVLQALFQPLNVPLFFQRLRRDVVVDGALEHVLADAGDGFAHVGHVQQFVTLAVDGAALIVSDVVVFQQLLTDVEVAALYLALGVGDRLGHPRVLNRFAFFHTQFTHHAGHAIRSEDTHQGIFHRQVEAG